MGKVHFTNILKIGSKNVPNIIALRGGYKKYLYIYKYSIRLDLFQIGIFSAISIFSCTSTWF